MLNKQISEEEIDKMVAEIKATETFSGAENIKINRLKKAYFRTCQNKRLLKLAENVHYNYEYLVRKHKLNNATLTNAIYEKTGIFDYQLAQFKFQNPEDYGDRNIFRYAMLLGFTFNINYLDILLYKIDYLEKKNLLSPF